jgi:iron complex outermembrane receptor protein
MRSVIRLLLLIILLPCLAHPAFARQGATVSGTVTNASGKAVVGATVTVVSSANTREAKSDHDGKFNVLNVPAGTYQLQIRADGYLTTRTDLTVGTTAPPIEAKLASDPHFSEVVSVSPNTRSTFDSYQPTSVLGGQDLAVHLKGTLGATIDTEPGVATRSFGPGPARPVIRGLDGDRVLVLENGGRMGDLSSQSGDHGVNVNPAAARKIEVVRGPATLLYGANAIGGLVNVITDAIPTTIVTRPSGTLTFDAGSAAGDVGGAGSVTAGRGPVALHFAGSARRAGDFEAPDGSVPNSFNRAGFVEMGISRVSERWYVGASAGYDKTRYGIPFVEEGETNLDPRRTLVDVRAERREMTGLINSFRASLGVRRYQHDELDGEVVATSFTNNTTEATVLANHRPFGSLKGTLGATLLTRSFNTAGEESLSPAVDQRGFAALVYEEAALRPRLTLQFGGRLDYTNFDPAGLTPRSFTNGSGSIGLLVKASDHATIAFSLANASRNPALEELYFHGPHPGNVVVENGDETLQTERATGFDTSVRWQALRATGEVTYFFNQVNSFIFRQLTGVVDPESGLPDSFFTQDDARLQGIESHVDIHATDKLWFEGGLDYVRGELTTLDMPLPRMPPLRGRVGVRFQHNAFQAGVDGIFTAAQDRIFNVNGVGETATSGYNLAKLFAAYSFDRAGATSTIAVHLDNAGNLRYHNHLNYLKDFAPEVGRDLRVTYTVSFR